MKVLVLLSAAAITATMVLSAIAAVVFLVMAVIHGSIAEAIYSIILAVVALGIWFWVEYT